jgi:hypothetical protein
MNDKLRFVFFEFAFDRFKVEQIKLLTRERARASAEPSAARSGRDNFR